MKAIKQQSISLQKSLLYSHLWVAALGVVILIIGTSATLWLRENALELAHINSPKITAVNKLQSGLQHSIADLRGWMAIADNNFKENRQQAWLVEIYPSLAKLKTLNTNQLQKEQLKTLQKHLADLEMWQWHIEDIAQTPGNEPARIIFIQRINPIAKHMFDSALAIVELNTLDNSVTNVAELVSIRTDLYEADQFLRDFLEHGKQININALLNKFAQLKKHINQVSVAALQQQHSSVWHEQFAILKNSYLAYEKYAHELIKVRNARNWNNANYLLITYGLPLEVKIIKELDNIEKIEQKYATTTTTLINDISAMIPKLMAFLLLSLLIIAYLLAKKGSMKFVKPVIELEKQDRLKSDVSNLVAQLQGIDDVNIFSQQLINELCLKTTAHSGAFFITNQQEQYLELTSSYALSKKVNYCNIHKGEGLVGQVYADQQGIEIINNHDDLLISSFLMTYKPKSLLIEPVIFDNDLTAVIELASLTRFNEYQKEYLHKSIHQIAVFLSSITQKQLIKVALRESQSKSEELQAQQEELRLTNEELEVKTEELVSQQEELKLSNEELTDNSEILKRQATELEQSKNEAIDKAKELEEAGRYKSEFLANMSHELRTPLNSLLILADSLVENDEGNLNKDEQESAQVIQESGRNLLELINDILDLSKIEAGHMQIYPEIASINDIKQSLQRNFNHMAEDKALIFSIKVANDVPKNIVTDIKKLNQILVNLIGNALKFTQQGHVKLTITVCDSTDIIISTTDRLIAFCISDTGVGINTNKLDSIFHAFKQADGAINREFGGTGLGLSISLHLAHLLAGDIQVHSVINQGSDFTLYIPFQESEVGQKQEFPPSEDSNNTGNTCTQQTQQSLTQNELSLSDSDDIEQQYLTENKLLLLVSDITLDISNNDYLTAQNISIKNSIDSEEIITCLANQQVLLLVLDLDLTEVNSVELLQQITDNENIILPELIIYSHKQLAKERKDSLHLLTNKIIIKSEHSDERLVNEISHSLRALAKEQSSELYPAENNHALKGVKALIVDDDMRNTFALTKVLRKLGMDITIATSGEKCLIILEQQAAFDVVLMDIMMPKVDGYQTIAHIRNNLKLKTLPIIALTAKAMPGDKEKCLAAGANDYLAKPIEMSKLITMMQMWMK